MCSVGFGVCAIVLAFIPILGWLAIMAGWITMPTIAAQLRWTLHIAHLARRSGIDLYVSTTHLGHTYPMFHQVFTDALPWLCAHLSSPVLRAPAQPVGTRAGPP